MFIAALFTIARIRKQPKCPLADKWIQKWYMYTVGYSSAIKRKKKMPFVAPWKQLEITMLSQSVRERHIPCHLYVESKLLHK